MKANDGRIGVDGFATDEHSRFEERGLEPIVVARECARRERREVAVEIEAFDDFEACVEATEVVRAVAAPTLGFPTSDGNVSSPSDEMKRVREAYRETVMAVDHYDHVYDESIESNLAAEFGPDIESGICDGGGAAFTPQFKRALLAACERNRIERRSFLAALDRELDSLQDAESTLYEVVTTISTSRGGDGEFRTRAVQGAVDSLVNARQELVHGRVSLGRADGHDLCAYLYHDEPWTYPVLYVAASIRSAIENEDRRRSVA